MIQFDRVSKHYGKGQDALRNVSFNINQGDMVFLTGHSGAGKSTLLKLIALLERANAGQIIVNHHNLNRLSKRKIPQLRRSMGIVFQNPHLILNRTVYENVALPLIISGYPHYETAKRVRAALDKVGLLHKEKCFPDALSGGEQQRVGIARAVVNKPHLILADEPTGNLDPQLSQEIMGLFNLFNQVGVTILIASHDLNLITSMEKPIISLVKGQIISPSNKGNQGAIHNE